MSARRRRISERDYIVVSSLAKLRIGLDAVTEGGRHAEATGIPAEEYRAVVRAVAGWVRRLEGLVDTGAE